MSTSVVCMLLLTACFVSCLARSHPPALTEVEGLVNKGKSALMFSNAPDICFIRDIPQKEQFWRARGCKNGVVLVLLLLACLSSSLATRRGHRPQKEDVLVHKEGDVKQEDGSNAHLSKLSDVDCLFEQDTTTFADGSTSAVLKDYESGQSVVVFSKKPDVCYVRDISRREMARQAAQCRGGVVSEKPGSRAGQDRIYVEGGELTLADLSPVLAEACNDSSVLIYLKKAHPSLPSSSPAPTESSLKDVARRSCIITRKYVCGPVTFNCRDVCTKYGWWTGKNKCKRKERRCDKGEKCYDKIYKSCI
ncbi:hypothetical protein BaRGS_00034287 [Batillaria attramentaria]|uniref:Uncharacterized protein n=1 Tax=Batillaria attramentaria TaxID=370345 RepID=A0ABD0JIB0_9CAEN